MSNLNEFVFRPNISPSEKIFRDKIGMGVWEKMKSKSFRDSGHKCCGCGFEPYEVDPNDVLSMHLVEEDEEDPENSHVVTICQICHITQHADVAMDRGYVKLVNSYFTQGEMVNICRNRELSYHLKNGEIRFIKKTLPEFLEELESGRAKEGKVKFVLTESYLNSIGFH